MKHLILFSILLFSVHGYAHDMTIEKILLANHGKVTNGTDPATGDTCELLVEIHSDSPEHIAPGMISVHGFWLQPSGGSKSVAVILNSDSQLLEASSEFFIYNFSPQLGHIIDHFTYNPKTLKVKSHSHWRHQDDMDWDELKCQWAN